MPTTGFSTKPLKVKLLAGEQKATKEREWYVFFFFFSPLFKTPYVNPGMTFLGWRGVVGLGKRLAEQVRSCMRCAELNSSTRRFNRCGG